MVETTLNGWLKNEYRQKKQQTDENVQSAAFYAEAAAKWKEGFFDFKAFDDVLLIFNIKL